MNMEIVKQLAVFLENRPGALLRLTEDLAQRQINILAMSVTDSVDHAVVRLVVDKPSDAIHIMGETGVLVVENDLIKIPMKNHPGELQSLCQKLREKDINIEYAYGSSAANDFSLYIRVLEPAKLVDLIKG